MIKVMLNWSLKKKSLPTLRRFSPYCTLPSNSLTDTFMLGWMTEMVSPRCSSTSARYCENSIRDSKNYCLPECTRERRVRACPPPSRPVRLRAPERATPVLTLKIARNCSCACFTGYKNSIWSPKKKAYDFFLLSWFLHMKLINTWGKKKKPGWTYLFFVIPDSTATLIF